MFDRFTTKALFSVLLISSIPACSWVDDTGRQTNQPLNVDLRLGDQSVGINKNTALYRAQLFEQNTYQLTVSDDSPISSFQYELEQENATQQCVNQGYAMPENELAFSLPEACGPENADCQIELSQNADSTTQIDITVPKLYAHYGAVYRLNVENQDNENINTQFLLCFTAVNEAPIVSPVADAVAEAGSVVLEPLLGATDDVFIGNQALSLSLQSDGKSPLISAAQGQVTVTTDGKLLYQHDGSQKSSQDSFQFLVSDGQKHTIGQATVSIGFDNDAPVAVDDAPTPAIAEGGMQVFSQPAQGVLNNDYDEETPNSGLTVQILQRPKRASSFVMDANTGYFNYTHDGSETTQDSFTYRISDGQRFSGSATVTLQITPVNDPPIFTNVQNLTASAGQPFAYTLRATDAESDPIQFSLSGSLPPGINFSNGTFSGTPTTGSEGQYSLQVEARDNNNGITPANLLLTVNANLPPIIVTAVLPNALLNQAYSTNVTANDSDGSNNGIRYSLSNAPAWLSINNITGALTGTPTTTGSSTLTVTATDDVGLTGSRTFTLDVSSAPTISTSVLPAGKVGDAYQATVIATDSDNGTLRFSLSGASWASINANTGVITGTPTTGGPSSVTVTVTDDDQLSAQRTFSISVALADNSAPVFQTTSLPTATAGTAYSANIMTTDADGDAVTVSSTNTPTWLTLSSNGALSGTPLAAGTSSFMVVANDGRDTRQVIFSITVNAGVAINSAPVFQTAANLPNATVGTNYNASVVATDADADTLSFSTSDLPTWMTLDLSTGDLSGTPTAAGSASFTINVSDGTASASRTFSLTIDAGATAGLSAGGFATRSLTSHTNHCWAIRAGQRQHTHLARVQGLEIAQYLTTALPTFGEIEDFRDLSGSVLFKGPQGTQTLSPLYLQYHALTSDGASIEQQLDMVFVPELLAINVSGIEGLSEALSAALGNRVRWLEGQSDLISGLTQQFSHGALMVLDSPLVDEALSQASHWANEQGRYAYALNLLLPAKANSNAINAQLTDFNLNQSAVYAQAFYGDQAELLATAVKTQWLSDSEKALRQHFCR